MKEKIQAQRVLQDEEFRKCADFHGHICPGLAIGYKAAKLGLDRLAENRAPDEEIVAIVENSACGTDAIQVLTGCTFGKGNLVFKDYGKQAFTLVSRESGKGIRIVLKPHVLETSDRYRELTERMRNNNCIKDEIGEFWDLHVKKAFTILEKAPGELFSLSEVNIPLPPKAIIEPSMPCARCGEPVMISRLKEVNGKYLCTECIGY